VHTDSTNVWNGQRNAFSQFGRGMVIEDHGRVEKLEAYFRDMKYRNQKFGLRFNTMFWRVAWQERRPTSRCNGRPSAAADRQGVRSLYHTMGTKSHPAEAPCMGSHS
jgi:hypothetical protein